MKIEYGEYIVQLLGRIKGSILRQVYEMRYLLVGFTVALLLFVGRTYIQESKCSLDDSSFIYGITLVVIGGLLSIANFFKLSHKLVSVAYTGIIIGICLFAVSTEQCTIGIFIIPSIGLLTILLSLAILIFHFKQTKNLDSE